MSGGTHYFWLGASADADPALVASDQAATPLAPTGFDPLRFEFRPDSRGKFDELVAYFANGLVFFEDLGENGLFVDIVGNDNRGVRLWASAKRGCLTYNHETDR